MQPPASGSLMSCGEDLRFSISPIPCQDQGCGCQRRTEHHQTMDAICLWIALKFHVMSFISPRCIHDLCMTYQWSASLWSALCRSGFFQQKKGGTCDRTILDVSSNSFTTHVHSSRAPFSLANHVIFLFILSYFSICKFAGHLHTQSEGRLSQLFAPRWDLAI